VNAHLYCAFFVTDLGLIKFDAAVVGTQQRFIPRNTPFGAKSEKGSPMRCLCVVCGLLLLSSYATGTDTEPTPPPDPDADILKGKFDPASLGSVLAYVTSDNDAYVKDLFELASIASISALPAHSNDVLEAAGWLKTRLATAGMENVQVLHTEGPQPVVGGTLSGCIHPWCNCP